MSESQIKPIKISPELFSLNPRRAKNKTQKKFKPNIPNIQPNKLKSELIAKIKNYKHNKDTPKDRDKDNGLNNDKDKKLDLQVASSTIIKSVTSNPNPIMIKNLDLNQSIDPDDEFTASLNFLKELSSKNKKKQNNKGDLEKVLSINDSENMNESKTLVQDNQSVISNNSSIPQYGCLRNGTLPTYREWKNRTLKKSDDNKVLLEEQNTKDSVLDLCQESKKKPKTYKYYLGKRGRKVSVLVKNAETRKKISSEHLLLKQAKLSDMKNYLKHHNLLRSGSHAPLDVIKKLYEQSLLSGEIRNSNKDNLIHNYLAEN